MHFAVSTASPDDAWMRQIGRNLTDAEDGFFTGKQHVLMDRDTKFSTSFRDILDAARVSPVTVTPPQAEPERLHEAILPKPQVRCLGRLIFFGQKSLERTVRHYLEHYHAERNHQGLGNTLIAPTDDVGSATGDIQCRERLGGMLKCYHRAA